MSNSENRKLLEMIHLCVRYGLFYDMESKQIWNICVDAINRAVKEEHDEV